MLSILAVGLSLHSGNAIRFHWQFIEQSVVSVCEQYSCAEAMAAAFQSYKISTKRTESDSLARTAEQNVRTLLYLLVLPTTLGYFDEKFDRWIELKWTTPFTPWTFVANDDELIFFEKTEQVG